MNAVANPAAAPLLPAFTGAPAVDAVYHVSAETMLAALAADSVDLVVFSPPYNLHPSNRRGGGIMKNAGWSIDFADGYDRNSDDMPEAEYQTWIKSIIAESMRVSKGLVWVNHKTRFREGVAIHPLSFMPFPMWSEVVWDRGGSFMLNARKFGVSHEYVFGFGRPHYWDDKLNTRFTVWNIPPETGAIDHECPFPEQLIAPLIQASCPPGGVVLDPFMGSGTVGAVAKKLGRHYIGSDNAIRHVEYARRRIERKTVLPMDELPLFAGLTA